MNESQLLSVHLSGERRNRFRRARAHVMRARGTETYDQEHQAHDSSRFDATAVRPEFVKHVKSDFMLIFNSEFVFPLRTGLNTIGRFRTNDIVLTPRHISRRHCGVLIHASGACEFFDFASRNGVFCNDVRIEDSVGLSSGDIIRICDHHFVFFSRREISSNTLSGV